MQCIRNYFRKKFHYESERFPTFTDVTKEEGIDIEVEASGFTREMQKTFDEVLHEKNEDEDDVESDDDDDDDYDDDSEAGSVDADDTQLSGCQPNSPSAVSSNNSTECKETVDIADDFAGLTTQETATQPLTSTTAVENPCSIDNSSPIPDCHDTSVVSCPSVEAGVVGATSDLADLTNQNRETRPFRDAPTAARAKPCPADDFSDSGSDVEQRPKAVVDVRAVKQKIKTQHQKQQVKQAARRAVKRGEAAVVTRARRQNTDAIQHRAGWDFWHLVH